MSKQEEVRDTFGMRESHSILKYISSLREGR